ncbi:40S ribosomal protein S4, X isoform-like [Sigmodon hispidus]
MLEKLTCLFTLTIGIFLRDKLKYDLKICTQHFIKFNGKITTDVAYPVGTMDFISIDKSSENFHLVYNMKGCFGVYRIKP